MKDRIYRADFGSYILWLGLVSLPLIPVAVVLAKLGWLQFQAKGLLLPSGFLLAPPVIAAAWLARYRLSFTSSGIFYRSWRKSWNVSYANIASVSASRVAPISRIPIGTYVYFKDGGREIVYTKAFSLAAIKDLFSLGAAA